jgi:Lhr-like helicase
VWGTAGGASPNANSIGRAHRRTNGLEVGVDIGDVNLVALVGAPPDKSRLLQKISRGGRCTVRLTPFTAVTMSQNRRNHPDEMLHDETLIRKRVKTVRSPEFPYFCDE